MAQYPNRQESRRLPKVKVFVNPLKGAEHDHSKPDWSVSFLCVPGTPNAAESLELVAERTVLSTG